MVISFSILLPILFLVLALGIFLALKSHKLAWKIVGWVLVALIGLLFVLVTRTDV